eukprot:3110754-Prymnesium_polylepis.1
MILSWRPPTEPRARARALSRVDADAPFEVRTSSMRIHNTSDLNPGQAPRSHHFNVEAADELLRRTHQRR